MALLYDFLWIDRLGLTSMVSEPEMVDPIRMTIKTGTVVEVQQNKLASVKLSASHLPGILLITVKWDKP